MSSLWAKDNAGRYRIRPIVFIAALSFVIGALLGRGAKFNYRPSPARSMANRAVRDASASVGRALYCQRLGLSDFGR
jgi:hypothetical protein